MCIFILLHITAQSGPVILVILCHSHWSSQGGINDTCYENLWSDATKGTHSLYLYKSYLSPEHLVLPPLLPCCSLDYLGWQLLNQPFLFSCVCVFIKVHITTQSGPVILVILCHSHWSSQGGINDTCYENTRTCVCVCVCVFTKLHITAQSGPAILVILCHSHWSSQGGINYTCYENLCVCVCVCIY